MKRLFTLVATVTILGLAVPSSADTFQFQGQSLNGSGNFTFDTTTNTLTVSGALIDTLTTLFDNGVGPCQSNCSVSNGSLSMSLTGATLAGGVYTFSSGGGLDVDGTVLDSGNNTIAAGDLLSAGFLSGATLQCSNGTCDFGGTLDPASIALSSGINIYGQTPIDGSALQTLKINIQGSQGYSGSVTEANVLVDTVDPVPEPASLSLIGFGLVGAVGILRKKKYIG